MDEFNGLKFADFDHCLRECKSIWNMEDTVEKALDRHAREFGDFAEFYLPTQTATIVRLLAIIMRDESEWISYFCYDLNFGNYEDDGMIQNADGTPIPLHTTRQLWDLLIEDAKMTKEDYDAAKD